MVRLTSTRADISTTPANAPKFTAHLKPEEWHKMVFCFLQIEAVPGVGLVTDCRAAVQPRRHDRSMLILTRGWNNVNTNDANGRAVSPARCLENFLKI